MNEMSTVRHQMNELGFYTLPGAPKSPRDLIHEVQAAKNLGSALALSLNDSISKRQ